MLSRRCVGTRDEAHGRSAADLRPRTPQSIAGGRQRTLKAPIGCVGVGLHSGQRVSLTLRPAPAGPWHRVPPHRPRRRYPGAVRPRGGHAALPPFWRWTATAARIGTVEHVMAALAGCGIDNALVEVDGPEPPILDGSAAPFVFLLDCAGIVEQDAPRSAIEIRRPVRVTRRRCVRRTAPGASRHGRPGHGAVDRFRRRRDRPPGAVAAPDAGQLPPANWRAPAPSRWPRRSTSCAPPASPRAAAWTTPSWSIRRAC